MHPEGKDEEGTKERGGLRGGGEGPHSVDRESEAELSTLSSPRTNSDQTPLEPSCEAERIPTSGTAVPPSPDPKADELSQGKPKSARTRQEHHVVSPRDLMPSWPLPTTFNEDACEEVREVSLGGDAHVFDVVFKPTGPLGITFEWVADSTACTESPSDGGSAPMVEISPREGTQQSSLSTSIPPSAFSAHTSESFLPTASERYEAIDPPLQVKHEPSMSSTQAPICSSSPSPLTSTPKGSHALRIKSFPNLPDEVLGSSVATQTTDVIQSLLRSEMGNVGGGDASHEQAEGRELLRHGDVLVAVNGTPLAGPAARLAGIQSFEQAVDLLRASSRCTKPRVLTFRRGQPSSHASLPPADVSPPMITAIGNQSQERRDDASKPSAKGKMPDAKKHDVMRRKGMDEQLKEIRRKDDTRDNMQTLVESSRSLSFPSNKNNVAAAQQEATSRERAGKSLDEQDGGTPRRAPSELSVAHRVKEEAR